MEHDPEVIFETVQTCIQACLEKAAASLGPVKVVAIGVTNQRETTIAWDRQTGRPLYNAIVWLDNRTVNICRRMQHELGSSVKTLPLAPVLILRSSLRLKALG